jgi:hypothetical protein
MTPTIRCYLFAYIAKRRVIALVVAIGWLILQHWLTEPRISFIVGIGAMLAIVTRPIWFLCRRCNPVAAAIEIESRHAEFDQRLITIASQPHDSAMLMQLMIEVEAITARTPTRVPLRPLLAPALALVAALLLSSAMHVHLLDVAKQLLNRSGR